MDIKVKLYREENIQYFNSEEIIIDIDRYLLGVVPSEIGNANVAACAAQAIASRTYAINTVKADGYITDKSDLHQAFRASRFTDYPNAYEGVEQTKGKVLYYNGKLAKCYYCASNGGQTTSSKERWGGDFPYLISQSDEFDKGPKNGHGVGLSQQGAAARGAAGHTYEQILSFYFPGTKIVKEVEEMATNNETKVLSWLEERIGNGYIYGAKGQICTSDFIYQQINQYPDYVKYDIVKKWIGKQVWDCATLVRFAMKEIGISMVSGATSQWNKTNWVRSGKIAELPKNKVCCLYRRTDAGIMQHTGIYLGNGYFIDARGSSTGVVKTKLEKYPWTHWGIPKGLYTEKELADASTPAIQQEVLKVLYKAKVIAESGSTVRMRSAASGSASTVAKVPVGSDVEVVAEQPEWKQIVYNGQTGFMMDDFLEKTEEAKPNEYYVKIKCSSAAEAERLAKLLATAVAN